MTMSLRGRLVIGVIALMAVGLAVAAVATYLALESFLLNRVDGQLASGHAISVGILSGQGPRNPGVNQFPLGTILEQRTPDGTLVGAPLHYDYPTSTSTAVPVVPVPLPSATEHNPAYLTLDGVNGVSHYRAAIWPEDTLGGNYVVLAIPIDDVIATMNQLLVREAIIGAGVVAATALLAWLIVNFGLRPLRRMGAVAGEIAAGDYSRRVEPTTKRTEIGRLGLALNAMLAQIEAAFAERTASENRLRRFIADASHELRTPLTSIRGYSEMLRRGAQESPSDADLARRRIEEESVRMSTLVDDMLLIARLDQGRPLEAKPVDLQVIARDAAADARAVAPQRDIKLDAPSTVLVAGDDTRLRQVVGNLVRNALVHTPSASPVEIAVTTQNGTAQLSVADHGPGLPAADREKIFEPFYRADVSRSRDSGGAGLGLSIVSAVVAAHGGKVKVRETQGGGATFDVELPLVAATRT